MDRTRKNISIKTFEYGYDIYRESVPFRNKVLLEPHDRPESCSDFDFPEIDIYIGAFLGEHLIGTVILTPRENGTVQMRQLAVEENYRSQGIGRDLVLFSENLARERGFSIMVLHARESAVAFYLRLGYERFGDRFLEIDLPHWEMKKAL